MTADPRDSDPISPALERLQPDIKVLNGGVSGLEMLLIKAEGLEDERVQRTVPYLGLVWLYSTAMRDLLHAKREDGRILWNAPALAVLCRALQDAFLSLYYFSIESPAPDEAQFRTMLLARHQAFKRWDLLRRSDPSNPEIAQELDQSKRDYDEVNHFLIEHPFVAQLPSNVAADIRGKPERFIADPLHEVWERAGMPRELYDVTFRYLSQYTHATPYAVSSLRFHQADHEDGAVNMTVNM